MRDVRTLTDSELDQVAAGVLPLINISGGNGGIGGAGGAATANQSITQTNTNTQGTAFVNKNRQKNKVYASNVAVGGNGGSANGGSVYLKF